MECKILSLWLNSRSSLTEADTDYLEDKQVKVHMGSSEIQFIS